MLAGHFTAGQTRSANVQFREAVTLSLSPSPLSTWESYIHVTHLSVYKLQPKLPLQFSTMVVMVAIVVNIWWWVLGCKIGPYST